MISRENYLFRGYHSQLEKPKEDLDLDAAFDNDILVLGTDESHTGMNIHPYAGMLGISILLKMDLEVYKSKVILLGKGLIGNAIAENFKKLDVEFKWFVDEAEEQDQKTYCELSMGDDYLKICDAIIFAEHEFPDEIFPQNSSITFEKISIKNPLIKIGVIAGNVDVVALKKSGLEYFPHNIKSFGNLSYQTFDLGPRPVLELFGAGMKVGEVMAKCRQKGFDLAKTVEYTLKNAPAMDFQEKGYMVMYKNHNV